VSPAREFVLVANTRLPSQRAQALQVVQSAAAFSRAGCRSTLLVAQRRERDAALSASELFDYYGVPQGARPTLERAACIDLIERVPTALQFWPSRLQEWSFARNAARRVLHGFPKALVIVRELEVGRALARARHPSFALELHRVPGGELRRRWLREAARGALGVLAISGGVREDLLALGLEPERVRVEHDALERERFAQLPSKPRARETLQLKPDAAVAVYTGGLLAWKGVEVLVDAARQLPAVQFVVAGGMDNDVARLREYARGASNVRFDGFQAPNRVPLYLAAADIGLVCNRSAPAISARYTSPLKVFESFAAGLPLVASDLPALRELLSHGEDAWLVTPDDPNALARGIEALLADGALRARISERVLERAQTCSWDARSARILSWLESSGCPASV
jgi:glycosyltransferase involved in cell wall biosynthesis